MRRITTYLSMAAAAMLLAPLPATAAEGFEPVAPPAAEPPSPEKPQKPSPPRALDQEPEADVEYVVQKGDTLADIAEEKLGTAEKWKVIARANGIEDPRTLRIGQKLKIPLGEAAGGTRTRL